MVTAFDKLYWTRISFGVLGGFAAENIFRLDYIDGFLLAILLYLVTYYIARFALFRKVPTDKLSKIYTTGIGGFTMLFIFTWLLLFTLSQV